MRADFILDYDTLAPNQAQSVYLMARIESGTKAPVSHTRRPLNISLAIDRSGSMAGHKLDYTRQSAQFLVQHLSTSDTLSIVLYNDKTETLLMPENVQRKDIINYRINQIKASGTTNLSGGWLQACTLVAQNQDPQALNRVILMSDGLANRGIIEQDRLVALAQQKFEEGVSTTTMGLGSDFNEDLLMAMAGAGGGAYYFIESPESAPEIFREELRGLLNVVAQNLTIQVIPAQNVTLNNQLNAYPMQSDAESATFRLGDVYAEEVKALMLELGVPGYSVTGQHEIAFLRVEYDDLDGDQIIHRAIDLPVTINVGYQRDESALPDPGVTQSVLLLKAAQARRRAVRAADRNDFETAANVLREAADEIESSNMDDKSLQDEQDALRQQAESMNRGGTDYAKYGRKTMSTQAHYTMTSRHGETEMLRMREKQKQKKATSELSRAAEPAPEDAIHIVRRDGVPPTHVYWNGSHYKLDGDLIRIGRDKHNEIVMAVKGVSRFHCQITRQNTNLILEDLGSTNGTILQGEAINAPHPLSVGDVVYICDEKLIFHDKSSFTSP